jgi:hypothetical protein
MFALNHDSSLKGDWRRLKFALQYMMDSRHAGHLVPSTGHSGTPWQSPAHFLYE